MKRIIQSVIRALNKVDTHGEESLNYLLASIQTLRNLADKLPEGDGVTVEMEETSNDDHHE